MKDKKIDEIIKKYKKYAKDNGFQINPNHETIERLVKGLLANEKKYGAKYCPCRSISGDLQEDKKKICPCEWHKEEIKKDGHCYCNMFIKK